MLIKSIKLIILLSLITQFVYADAKDDQQAQEQAKKKRNINIIKSTGCFLSSALCLYATIVSFQDYKFHRRNKSFNRVLSHDSDLLIDSEPTPQKFNIGQKIITGINGYLPTGVWASLTAASLWKGIDYLNEK